MKTAAIIITVLVTIIAFIAFSLKALADSVSEFDFITGDDEE